MTGTPQGGVVSPLLANLFLHYVFDRWMAKTHPHISFERYADDIICHCRTESEAAALLVQGTFLGVPATAASSEDEDCLL
jgi:retron-type reverse transcriptase